MNIFQIYLQKIKDKVYNRTQQTIANLVHSLTADLVVIVKGNESKISLQVKTLPQNNQVIDQKVLQIDVIESGYILKTQENILPPNHSNNQVQLSARSKQPLQRHKSPQSHSRLKDIEQQKRAILEELKQLDNQIAQIKGEKVQDLSVKRKQKEEQSQQAKKKAKQLVRQLKLQKKELQQKKKKEAEKSLLIMKQEEQQFKKKRQQQIIRAKQQRRRAIESRMQEQKRKRQQRKFMEKESNKLIKQLKKEQQIAKQKDQLPHQVTELELKKKVIAKKQEISFRQIQQHQRNYLVMKEQDKSLKKDRSESVGRPVPKYPKNMWIQQIQQQQLKRKEQQKIKETIKKIQLQKRKKYGELVKNIFIPKMKKETIVQETTQRGQIKPQTPEAFMLPKIAESDKRVTDSKPMRKFMEQNRPFATAHPKPPKPHQIKQIRQKQPEDEQKLKERKLKQAQLRRQTKQRLKKLQNRSVEVLTKSKPKYQNYLGQLRSKLGCEAQSWKKVIGNQNLSKEEKYKQMVRRAQALQNKAKVKQEVRKPGDEDALNLYIGSIQAKLAILQQF